jgi:hypothetical protein
LKGWVVMIIETKYLEHEKKATFNIILGEKEKTSIKIIGDRVIFEKVCNTLGDTIIPIGTEIIINVECQNEKDSGELPNLLQKPRRELEAEDEIQ